MGLARPGYFVHNLRLLREPCVASRDERLDVASSETNILTYAGAFIPPAP